MVGINLKHASIDFPIYNAKSRSLASSIFGNLSLGRLDADSSKGLVTVKSLQDIELEILDGERVGLVGNNGAGKSTLLRTLAGVYRPTSGHALIEGRVASLIDISLGINPEATGRENIFLRGALLGLTKDQVREKFDEIVAFSELGNFIEMPLRTYSSGMQMRLGFAVSMVVDPEILLMDEWLSVGDGSFQKKAEEKLKSLVNQTRILVIASHNPDLIRNICSRTIWLDSGKIKMDGNPKKVLEKYQSST